MVQRFASVFRRLDEDLKIGARFRLAGELEAPRTSFFPSIKETLNHIITVDWFYIDGLEGGTLGLKAFEVDEP
ncbi:hypothetical protein AB9F34_33540, partial [Rhizobium leguminosarum]